MQTRLHIILAFPIQSTCHFKHHTWMNIPAKFDVHQTAHHRALGASNVDCQWSPHLIFHSKSRHPSLVNLHHFTYIEMSFVRLSRHGVLFVKHRQKHGQTSLHSTPTLPTQSTHHFNHHVWYTWINIHARFDVHQRTHHRALGALVVNCHQLSPDLPFEGLPSILGNLPSLRTHGQSIYETCTTRRAVHGAAEPIQRLHSTVTLPCQFHRHPISICVHIRIIQRAYTPRVPVCVVLWPTIIPSLLALQFGLRQTFCSPSFLICVEVLLWDFIYGKHV